MVVAVVASVESVAFVASVGKVKSNLKFDKYLQKDFT